MPYFKEEWNYSVKLDFVLCMDYSWFGIAGFKYGYILCGCIVISRRQCLYSDWYPNCYTIDFAFLDGRFNSVHYFLKLK